MFHPVLISLFRCSRFLTVAMLASATVCACSQNRSEEGVDLELRLAPQMDSSVTTSFVPDENIQTDYDKYPFLKKSANVIIPNGASWKELSLFYADAKSGNAVFDVVHIGDSHIQAEGATSVIRQGLQARAGNAGRGLMIPFKIAGTNQPLDYKIALDAPSESAKLLNMPWTTDMGFTGIGIHPQISSFAFTVEAPDAFRILRIYAKGAFQVKSVSTDGKRVEYSWQTTDYGGILTTTNAHRKLTIKMHGDKVTVFGFDARTSGKEKESGVLYHAIGNNGATYGSYSSIGGMGTQISALNPKLIIISLGANESYGNITDARFYSRIKHLMAELKSHNPDAQFLLTTPAECYKSAYTAKGNKNAGSHGKSRSYVINTNVLRLRNVILEYGRKNHIPVYDFYEVAGGQGSAANWLKNGLLSNDRIHRTWPGYQLEGRLLLDALQRALDTAPVKTPDNSADAKPEP